MDSKFWLLPLLLISINGWCFFKTAQYINISKEITQRSILDSAKDVTDHTGALEYDSQLGSLYVSSPMGKIAKVSVDPFILRQQIDIESRVPLTLNGENVYGGDSHGNYYSLNKVDLKQKWKVFFGRSAVGKPSFDSAGNLYIMLEDETVVSLEKATGKIRWRYRRTSFQTTSIRGNTPPFLYKENLIVGTSDGYLLQIRQQDGSLVKEIPLFISRYQGKYFDVDAPIYPVSRGKGIVGYFGGELCLIDFDNFSVIGRFAVGNSRAILDLPDSLILAGTYGGIYKLDKESFKEVWKNEERSIPSTKPVFHDGKIYAFRMNRYMDILDYKTGKVILSRDFGQQGGFNVDPVLVEHAGKTQLFVISQNRSLISYQLQ